MKFQYIVGIVEKDIILRLKMSVQVICFVVTNVEKTI